jgi:hypothetical protein
LEYGNWSPVLCRFFTLPRHQSPEPLLIIHDEKVLSISQTPVILEVLSKFKGSFPMSLIQ